MKAAENAAMLDNVPVEVRNSAGVVICRTRTTAGNYQFDATNCAALNPANRYFIQPVVGRGQFVLPFQRVANGTDSVPPFQMAHVPSTLNIAGCGAGAMILITPAPYAGATPPTMVRGSSSTEAYTIVADQQGNAQMHVRGQLTGDPPYSITTWTPTITDGTATYTKRAGTLASNIGPNTIQAVTCP